MRANILILAICLTVCISTDKIGLYREGDSVNILTSENFTDIVCDKGKESAWVIQFYNAWCGHCRRFAPKFKKFAKDVKGWSKVISLGVVACSDNTNTALCRSYNIMAYPTMLLFPPCSTSNNKTNLESLPTQDPKEMRAKMASFVNETIPTPPSWPKLKPLKSIDEIWEEATAEHKHVLLIFEEPYSYLGLELILDYVNQKNILIRRMLKETVIKYGISEVPSLYIVNKEGTYSHIATGSGVNLDTDRTGFQMAINLLLTNKFKTKDGQKFLLPQNKTTEGNVVNQNTDKKGETHENAGAGDGPEDNKVEDSKINEIERPRIYMQDLESALQVSFRQEIALRKEIDGDNMIALQNYVSVLSKYLPGRDEIKTFLQQVNDWLTTVSKPLSGGDWLHGIDGLQDELVYLPDKVQWVGCKGSAAEYRGYPCSMWTLFHTLTVNAYLNEKVEDVKEVIHAIAGYMKYFFGCAECTENFLKMAASADKDLRKKKDMVIWLWSAHNKANKRLHGDLSEDPEYPKIQFPSPEACPKCYSADSKPWNPTWKTDEVLRFLVEMYRAKNIITSVPDDQADLNRLSYRKGIKSPAEEKSLDWWEKRLRGQDLKKLREIRERKKNKLSGKSGYFKNESVDKEVMSNHISPRLRTNWSLSSVDLGMCMAFYVICAIIVLMLYYHFTIRTKYKPICKCLPV
ncbi:hypothetical protein SNE40_001322 [Patella caerulea]|uniref:Sulfhydryl oxidase n=1 Tax=Patella caerulea TaxID=87958 RepID=A0AAN8Q3D6_PATCE